MSQPHDSDTTHDVLVLGATPAGIAAAVAATRMGARVALVEAQGHVGGMAASGLSKSDVENRPCIGGIFLEFVAGVRAHYHARGGPDVQACKDGYYYEPGVAEGVFRNLIVGAPDITLYLRHALTAVETQSGRIASTRFLDTESGAARDLCAAVYIDATYEGDLYAAAGAPFRLGREGRDAFGESLAGHIYYDYENGRILEGSTGAGDDGLPAYTYRLTLTTDPDNAVPLTEPPSGYDRSVYTPYFEDLEAGRLSAPKHLAPGRGYYPEHFDTLVRALSVTEIPNGKVDVNINPRPLAFPFPEENAGYVAGDRATRNRIAQRHRDLCLGLLWFLQHDAEVPEAHRVRARRYHLPRDEYGDSGHFPWQLYVREARRLRGLYTITQHDVTGQGPSTHADTIAMGEFPIDSFPVHKKRPGDTVVLEGYLGMLDHLTRPYPVPYRALLSEAVENLIVPGALSATHVAYSTLRMEPTWMALGHAAGAAAQLAVRGARPTAAIDVAELQAILKQQGQVLGVPKAGQ
jgi:hypothetical protein